MIDDAKRDEKSPTESGLTRWIKKRVHWQNMTEDGAGRSQLILRDGRAWFHRPWDDFNIFQRQIEVSWTAGSLRWVGFELRLYDGDNQGNIAISLGFVWFTLAIAFENFIPRSRARRHDWSHVTGLSLDLSEGVRDSFIFARLHYGFGDCDDCGSWRGWHKYFSPADLLFGRPVYSTKEVERETRRMSLPEGSYLVEVVLSDDRWKRPRWPWARVVRRAEVACKAGVPIPGKGDSSWDCGETRRFDLKCQAASITEGIQKFRDGIVERRLRYGGSEWEPEKWRSEK